MPKPRWRLSFRSFFGQLFDAAKHEQLQESKAEIDAKVESMLRELKEEEGSEKHAALAKMIEEFHSHYLTLYEQYDHLAEELRKEAEEKHAKKDSSSSSDSSDSDHTSKKKRAKNGEVEFDRVKQELQIAVAEVADLQLKLAAAVDGKEDLRNEYLSTLNKLEEAQNATRELSSAAEKLNEENGSLSLEISKAHAELSHLSEQLAEKERELSHEQESLNTFKGEVKEKLESAEADIDYLKRKKNDAEEENKNLCLKISELEDEIKQLGDKIQGHANEVIHLTEKLDEKERAVSLEQEKFLAYKKETEEKLDSAEKEISKLKQVEIDNEQDKWNLSLIIAEMEEKTQLAEKKIQDFVTEVQQLNENLSEKERALASQLEIHEAHKEEASSRQRDLELELHSSLTERKEFEEKKAGEFATLLQKLLDTETQFHTRDHEASHSQTQLETLKEELAKRELELGGVVEEKESLLSQLKEIETELDSTRNQKIQLDEEIKSKGIEISNVLLQLETLKEAVEKSTAEQQEKEENLEVKFKGLNVKIETLTNQIHEFEEQTRSQDEELKQLKDENENLKDKISLVEKLLIEKESEFSTARKDFEDGDNRKSALIVDLTAQISSLEGNLGLLAAQKSEADALIATQSENILELGVQIEKLKEELLNKTADGERGVEEKTILEASVKNKQLELENLQSQIGDLEAELSSKSDKENKLMEENALLRSMASELENALTDQAKNFEDVKNHLEILQAVKIQLEEQIEKQKQETIESLAVAENSHAELETKIMEHERKLTEKDDELFTLREEHKNLKDQFESNDEELRLSLKKIEEITLLLQSESDAKTGLEVHVEEVKRHLEIKSDEISLLVESLRNTEVKEKLTSQRLHVAEQMLNEKDENFSRKEEKLKEEQKLLADKLAASMERISAYSEAQKKITSEISHKVTATLSELDTFLVKFEEDYGHVDSRIYEITHELKELRNSIIQINTRRDQMKAQEVTLKRKISELENEVQKGVGEQQSLAKSVQERDEKIIELEKRMRDKEVGYVSLSEEKREAIRQLCIWIEYHRDRYDHLKNMIVVKGGKRR